MSFISFNFLIFFPLVVIFFFMTPAKYRWIILLISSYFFYINIKPVYALLVAGITLSTFIFTLLIARTAVESKRKTYMILNIFLILIPLLFFKYFSVINNSILSVLEKNNLVWPLPEFKLLLPVGISFYTFVAIGYTVDVYNEEVDVEKNPGILALFLAFFPLILSGPIERAKNMLPQFRSPRYFNYDNAVRGLKFMLWGYFMKLVVADRIDLYVDAVYSNISQHNGSTFILASVLHPFQVYADLGGYSLIAIGTAQVLGYNVMCNFNRPFFSTSMAAFWRRWHISLISWLTDYIYTPLAFSFRRKKIFGIVLALMLTFLISGIWHGAKLTHIIWGLSQGIFLSLEALTYNKRTTFEKKHNLLKRPFYLFLSMVITYVLFTASMIFARSENINDALAIYRKIFTESGPIYLEMTTLAYSFLGMLILFIKDLSDEFFPGRFLFFNNSNILIRYASYLLIIFLVLFIGVLNGSQFIYFQF